MKTHEKKIQTKFKLHTLHQTLLKLTPRRKKTALFRVKVLQCLSGGMYPAKVSRKLKINKSTLHYHLKVMEDAGLIFRESNTRPVFYRLSPSLNPQLKQTTLDAFPSVRDDVLKQLIGHERLMLVNTHAVKIRLDVLEGPLPDVGKIISLRNGVKRCLTYVNIDGVSYCVYFNKGKGQRQSITIQPPAVYGKSEIENIARCMELGERIRKFYHIHLPRVQLDKPTIVDEEHHMEDPALIELIQDEHTRYQIGPVKVDGSPTSGFETKDRLTMQDYRLMPLRVKSLERQLTEIQNGLKKLRPDEKVDRLEEKVDTIAETLSKMTGVFEKFMDAMSQSNTPPPDGWFG